MHVFAKDFGFSLIQALLAAAFYAQDGSTTVNVRPAASAPTGEIRPFTQKDIGNLLG
ncbi:MAG TPA: hypothetical protein VIT23_18600 [Terrimicrobiaceae bacterium]